MQEIKQMSSKQEISLDLGNRINRKTTFSVELGVEHSSKDMQDNQQKVDELNKKLEEPNADNSGGV
jgi:hypothetical protein